MFCQNFIAKMSKVLKSVFSTIFCQFLKDPNIWAKQVLKDLSKEGSIIFVSFLGTKLFTISFWHMIYIFIYIIVTQNINKIHQNHLLLDGNDTNYWCLRLFVSSAAKSTNLNKKAMMEQSLKIGLQDISCCK